MPWHGYGGYILGNIGTILEKKMETIGIINGFIGIIGPNIGFRAPIMENQMEKKMANEMETGIILGL